MDFFNQNEQMNEKNLCIKPKIVTRAIQRRRSCVICSKTKNLKISNNYVELLMSLFHIKLIDLNSSGELCGACVLRLRDALALRSQVEAVDSALASVKDGLPLKTEDISLDDIKIEPDKADGVKVHKEEDESNEFDCWDPFEDLKSEGEVNDLKETVEQEEPKNKEWSDKTSIGKVKKKKKRKKWSEPAIYPKQVPLDKPKLPRGTKECPICHKVCKDRPCLVNHYKYHFPRFLCEICGKLYALKEKYKGHMQSHESTRFPCTQCNKTYANKGILWTHIKVTHKQMKLYACPKCDERFDYSYKRKGHMLKSHGIWDNVFPCPECQLTCFSASRLKTHIRRIHQKLKTVSCLKCKKLFHDKDGLALHLKSHSDVRNFICDMCSKALKNRRSLENHLKIHYNIRDHKCELCGLAFVQLTSLHVHMKSHHKTVP